MIKQMIRIHFLTKRKEFIWHSKRNTCGFSLLPNSGDRLYSVRPIATWKSEGIIMIIRIRVGARILSFRITNSAAYIIYKEGKLLREIKIFQLTYYDQKSLSIKNTLRKFEYGIKTILNNIRGEKFSLPLVDSIVVSESDGKEVIHDHVATSSRWPRWCPTSYCQLGISNVC